MPDVPNACKCVISLPTLLLRHRWHAVRPPGTRRAAELYRRLAPYMAPTEPVGCLPVSLSFVHSECLIAVGSTLEFKVCIRKAKHEAVTLLERNMCVFTSSTPGHEAYPSRS